MAIKTCKKKKKSNNLKKSRKKSELENLTLGQDTNSKQYSLEYCPQILETIENKGAKTDSWVSFICTEFTTLCPKTGQPDFAKIYINYIPDLYLVESKSLKLYLFGFRNHGGFHEDCVKMICDDLKRLLKPRFLEVIGEFTPRGGICIWPYASCSDDSKKFKKIKEQRMIEYRPGKYSINLSQIY